MASNTYPDLAISRYYYRPAIQQKRSGKLKCNRSGALTQKFNDSLFTNNRSAVN